jgi:hypothetical protein
MVRIPQLGEGALRELAMVLAVALVGLLLAALAAFTPWYAGPASTTLVEMNAPAPGAG